MDPIASSTERSSIAKEIGIKLKWMYKEKWDMRNSICMKSKFREDEYWASGILAAFSCHYFEDCHLDERYGTDLR